MSTSISADFQWNEVTKKLPKHLHKFIVKQPYADYTAQNHAVWRYVLRLHLNFLPKVAHDSYVEGLKKTGITTDIIPAMEGMNRILKDIGWAAVAVDGFIPPNAFMEFQAYQVLVIASDIRNLAHISYTPAPDIIHEAAGHAPIIAHPEYAEYLRRFGAIGCKAISSAKDHDMYEAVRKVSILKEDPNTSPKDLEKGLTELQALQEDMGELSEMAQIRNLHWWTVEYGLIGTLENPRLYGAGLLSSIEESAACLEEKVTKKPFNIAAAQQNFDITQPQPHLYVTPNFAHLSYVLEKFANTMALRTGGLDGVKKLIASQHIGTVELSTGLQISGQFSEVIVHQGKAVYLQTTGKTALATRETALIGHGVKNHPNGFGTALGKLENSNVAIEDMSPKDLEVYGICEGAHTVFNFEGGIQVAGEIITGKRDLRGKIILISFKNCTVLQGETLLFEPSWGTYDMAVGKDIVAAFAGPADPDSFEDLYRVSKTKRGTPTYTEAEKICFGYYQQVRDFRAQQQLSLPDLLALLETLIKEYPNEWLLILEIYELAYGNPALKVIETTAKGHLEGLEKNASFKKLIQDGRALIEK